LSYRTVVSAVQQPAHLNIKQVNNQFGLVLYSYTFPNEHINTHRHLPWLYVLTTLLADIQNMRPTVSPGCSGIFCFYTNGMQVCVNAEMIYTKT